MLCANGGVAAGLVDICGSLYVIPIMGIPPKTPGQGVAVGDWGHELVEMRRNMDPEWLYAAVIPGYPDQSEESVCGDIRRSRAPLVTPGECSFE